LRGASRERDQAMCGRARVHLASRRSGSASRGYTQRHPRAERICRAESGSPGPQQRGGTCRPRAAHRPHSRCPGRPRVHVRGATGRSHPNRACDPDAQGGRVAWGYRHLPARGPAVHRQSNRPDGDLRRPGGYRHRERTAAHRASDQERRPHRGPGAADGDQRDPARHLALTHRPTASLRRHRPSGPSLLSCPASLPISVHRLELRPFTDSQVALMQTFADQAAIAIENVRLFTELEARNGELRDALEQQTATSELLKVIGRSTFDLQPVFETLAENAVRLCQAERAFVYRFDGQLLRVGATHNASPELRAFIEANPIRPGRMSGAGRAALELRTVHILDAQADHELTYGSREVDPIRTVLAIPMLRAGELQGVITIYRLAALPFTPR